METLRSGMLAYYEGFARLISCKVIAVSGQSGPCGSMQEVRLMVATDKVSGYRRGEIITCWGLHAIPRKSVRRRKYSTTIRPYRVEVDKES